MERVLVPAAPPRQGRGGAAAGGRRGAHLPRPSQRQQPRRDCRGARKRVVVQVLDTLHADVCRAVDAAVKTAAFEKRVAQDRTIHYKDDFVRSIKDESAAHMAVCKALPNGAPTRRSRHKQPYSDQPRFRCTSLGLVAFLRCPRGRAARKRCTATAYAGFPGAQVQRSCTFAPGNPGLGGDQGPGRAVSKGLAVPLLANANLRLWLEDQSLNLGRRLHAAITPEDATSLAKAIRESSQLTRLSLTGSAAQALAMSIKK